MEEEMRIITILAILLIPKVLLSGWEIAETPTTKKLNSVECIGYGYAYAVGDDRTLLYSSDYGETWDTIPAPAVSPGLDFNDLFFWDELSGLIVCDSGKIYYTSDGGSSWIENTTPISNQHFYAVDFSPSSAGLAVGTSGWIVQGPDTMWTWFDWRIPTYSGRNIYDVRFPTNSLAYILAHRDFVRIMATDSVRYEMLIDFATTYLNGMCVLSSDPGWVYIVGDSGYVVFSLDSMNTYDVLAIYGNCDFNDIEFTYWDYGVICGDDGVIFESDNYGLDWDSVASGTTRNLNDIDFFWDNYGLIVGNYGTILRSTSAVGIKDKYLEMPSDISLSASPNPFNSSVRIAVEGECDKPLRVEIYDVAGRRVETLRPSATSLEKGGTDDVAPLNKGGQGGSYVWQPASSLPSGIYLVRARFGEQSVSKRVVYLK